MLKAGIWKKRSINPAARKSTEVTPRGFSCKGVILLETLICLAVLAIFLPSASHYVLKGWEKYHNFLLFEHATRLAELELAKLQVEVFEKYSDILEMPAITDPYSSRYDIHTKISDLDKGLKKLEVEIQWQNSAGLQSFKLEQNIYMKSIIKGNQ